MKPISTIKPDFGKSNGLVPAVIQHYLTGQVLMLGYMNAQAFEKTMNEKRVTFFSRSRRCLWTKGETSGNYLFVKEIFTDCDNDTLLIKVLPAGPVCHTGSTSCFGEETPRGFLYTLEDVISQRIADNNPQSYTNRIYRQGINRMAQKVGEEAVEVVIEAKDNNRDLFCNEAADLLYHLIVLLRAKEVSLSDIEQVLKERHK